MRERYLGGNTSLGAGNREGLFGTLFGWWTSTANSIAATLTALCRASTAKICQQPERTKHGWLSRHLRSKYVSHFNKPPPSDVHAHSRSIKALPPSFECVHTPKVANYTTVTPTRTLSPCHMFCLSKTDQPITSMLQDMAAELTMAKRIDPKVEFKACL